VVKFLPAAVADTSSPVAWTADQKKLLGNLATWMQAAAAVLVLLGVYVILNAVPPSLNVSHRQALALLEGLLTLGLGALLFAPARALGGMAAHDSCTTGCLQGALTRLACWQYAVAAMGLALVATVVLRFPLVWE